jgi:eukaryotic-like serine/threonine-protein kinase
VAAAAAVTVAVAAALIALALAHTAARGRLAEAERAQAIHSFLIDLLEEADPARAPGHETTVREVLDRGAARLPNALARQPRTRAELVRTMGALYHALGHDERATPLQAEALRLAEAEYGPTARRWAAYCWRRPTPITGMTPTRRRWPPGSAR